MTSEPITFAWAELEAFRGFRDKQRVDLDASAVILAGPNGTGKTSFFDALQWLLLGSLERLEPWRTRRNTEHIVSAFRPDDAAIVTAGLRFGDDEVELRRQGRHDSGFLEWRDKNGTVRGDEAELKLAEALATRNRDRASLRRILMTSGLLQQDVVREVLEDKASDRYQHLASLLGLEVVGAFENAARKRADRFAVAGRTARSELATLETQRRTARDRLERFRHDSAEAPGTAAVRAQLAERLASGTSTVKLARELPTTATDVSLLQSAVAEIGDQLAQAQRRLSALTAAAADLESISDEAMKAAETTAATAAKAAEDARAGLALADKDLAAAQQRSEAMAALAHAALPLLSDHCPVCRQEIDEDHVRRHLEQLLAAGGNDLPERQRARDAALAALKAAETEARTTAATLSDLRRRREQSVQLAKDRDRLVVDVQSAIARAQQEGVTLLDTPGLAALEAEPLNAAVDDFRMIWRIAGDLGGVLRTLPVGEQIAEAERELKRVEGLVIAARERTTAASAREEEAKTLQRAATRAAAAVTEARFRLLAPLVSDIFSRLDPHPVFKAMDFALGVYRERGEASPIVLDAVSGVEADPLLIFSSSQANVAALSYFLALGWAAGEDAMPFVLLDDPLQSLDDVNSLGFADLCRHIRHQRQLIVSTHDPRLGALLERKLAPRAEAETTRVVEFQAWTRSGPEFDERLVPPQLVEGERRSVVAAEAA
jgi:DNA repair exonuclease SbcCD ATPase subunit